MVGLDAGGDAAESGLGEQLARLGLCDVGQRLTSVVAFFGTKLPHRSY